MDIAELLGGLATAASGGIFGMIGVGVKHWFDHKAEEAKRQFELAMRKLDREEMQLEHDLQMQTIEKQTERDIAIANQNRLTTETEVAGKIELSELAMRRESYAHDKATYGGGWVDKVRGLMRPGLTVFFAINMAIITYMLIQANNALFTDPDYAQDMLRQVINAIIFLTNTSVTWWFGSRPVKRG